MIYMFCVRHYAGEIGVKWICLSAGPALVCQACIMSPLQDCNGLDARSCHEMAVSMCRPLSTLWN